MTFVPYDYVPSLTVLDPSFSQAGLVHHESGDPIGHGCIERGRNHLGWKNGSGSCRRWSLDDRLRELSLRSEY